MYNVAAMYIGASENECLSELGEGMREFLVLWRVMSIIMTH